VTGFLIDTNVISEFVRSRPNERVTRWLEMAEPELLFASVITLGEIRLGIEDMPPGSRRTALERWLNEGMPAWFDSNLLPITRTIAERWGQVTIQAKRRGRPISTADGLIAATALVHGLRLATRDIGDYRGTGVELFDPWSEEQ
jgi:toxin FitB